eukprot:gene5787-6026_t
MPVQAALDPPKAVSERAAVAAARTAVLVPAASTPDAVVSASSSVTPPLAPAAVTKPPQANTLGTQQAAIGAAKAEHPAFNQLLKGAGVSSLDDSFTIKARHLPFQHGNQLRPQLPLIATGPFPLPASSDSYTCSSSGSFTSWTCSSQMTSGGGRESLPNTPTMARNSGSSSSSWAGCPSSGGVSSSRRTTAAGEEGRLRISSCGRLSKCAKRAFMANRRLTAGLSTTATATGNASLI